MKYRENYSKYAVCTANGPELMDTEPLIGA